jgi:hypothetical protein
MPVSDAVPSSNALMSLNQKQKGTLHTRAATSFQNATISSLSCDLKQVKFRKRRERRQGEGYISRENTQTQTSGIP